jgi:lincosamide nucleotidyltransferase A/C/D/E
MMTPEDVTEVVETLKGAGVSFWLDGGWGVDALLGRQTRPHGDLDVVIDRDDLPRARTALRRRGFRHARAVRPGLPARCVLRDRAGRQADLHPVALDASADGWQDLGDGTYGYYPAAGLRAQGMIAGQPVHCVTPELQLRHHLGYAPDAQDCHDLCLLAERFGLTLPAPSAAGPATQPDRESTP